MGIVVRSATQVTEDILRANAHLRFVGRGGVGIDNIHSATAQELGIPVLNTPKASTRSVAEMVFSLLMAGARFIPNAAREMPAADDKAFKKLKNAFADGLELQGKTLGLIGFGNIGQETARIALGLGMKVVVFKRQASELYVDIPQFGIQVPVPCVSFDTLLQESDVISLHIPSNPNGYILGDAEFKRMKQGAVIINTSRGGLIDETALVANLNSGHLGFACLDVFEGEPHIKEAVRTHSSILCTPHIGGSTPEAQDRVWTELADSILKVIQ